MVRFLKQSFFEIASFFAKNTVKTFLTSKPHHQKPTSTSKNHPNIQLPNPTIKREWTPLFLAKKQKLNSSTVQIF